MECTLQIYHVAYFFLGGGVFLQPQVCIFYWNIKWAVPLSRHFSTQLEYIPTTWTGRNTNYIPTTTLIEALFCKPFAFLIGF